MVLLLIFFVKQKTAYEMRISDWSSDVCSSDLKEGFDEGNLIADSGKYQGIRGECMQAPADGRMIRDDHTRPQAFAEIHVLREREVFVRNHGQYLAIGFLRSDERREGKEGVSTCRSGGAV